MSAPAGEGGRGPVLAAVEAYYTEKIRAHGPTPRGADWNSAESQILRFRELLRVCEAREGISLLDYGCGYGALRDHLQAEGLRFHYRGFDVSPAMIDEARRRHPDLVETDLGCEESRLSLADYVVASGIFNVRLETSDTDWRSHMLGTLQKLDALATRGFSFNALSTYSDPERRRPDLYYADPLFFFDHCKRTFCRYVSLIHDYPLYEFTILVRKRGG
jgi:SAM-dependent methyltransferase